ncbi:hypothetical protein BUALT_Bualt12G0058900 [Buddleja alternifolia]|uniref:Uncharacterized protein n=1 Tax=Buddleja alternifolia TaxID=168488 RepID=A0AAV6WVP1_9LAMI|nr:hypothetical protein BUALT_Bualt12G0058900 [Buddleja alternifolia]
MDLLEDDEEIVKSGEILSYPLELRLRDCFKAVKIFREAMQRLTGRSVEGLPLEGGAACVLHRDGMARALVVWFSSAKRASDLKFFLEDPLNYVTIFVEKVDLMMKSLSGGLVDLQDSKNVLDFLQSDFPDMDVIGVSDQLNTSVESVHGEVNNLNFFYSLLYDDTNDKLVNDENVCGHGVDDVDQMQIIHGSDPNSVGLTDPQAADSETTSVPPPSPP